MVCVDVLTRNNVTLGGQPGGQPMMFAHGYGCDQNMWRFVAPAFEADYRIVLFDYVGSGKSELRAYEPKRYGSLDGYARDVLEICAALELSDVIFVGHSVSGMVGVLAAIEDMKADKPIFAGGVKDNEGNVVSSKTLDLYDGSLWGTNYLIEGVIGSIT